MLSSLPLANEPITESVALADPVLEEKVSLRTELAKVWRDILNSVQISRVDNPPRPLLVPEQRYFLTQNLSLNLATAEMAMMKGETAIFQGNLAESIQWLKEYFDLKDEAVNSALQQLMALQLEPLDSEIPDISGSYEMLQSIKGGQ
jgi:uroporphyrin-3 C-methyltransferase